METVILNSNGRCLIQGDINPNDATTPVTLPTGCTKGNYICTDPIDYGGLYVWSAEGNTWNKCNW